MADAEDPEHFPWHYTEFGVICVCGDAMDASETCLSKTQPPTKGMRSYRKGEQP